MEIPRVTCETYLIGSPGYNPRTLYIPRDQWTMFTPFEKQYWEFKSKLFDTVLFFKKGKFYELYETDADIGAVEFDLKMTDRVNMRMVGVPECNTDYWISRFVQAGYKVAVVDQEENSISKSITDREIREKGDAKVSKIIKRELKCILTAGTLTEPSMLRDKASYCCSVSISESGAIGVVAADVSSGRYIMRDIKDEESHSELKAFLLAYSPEELVYQSDGNIWLSQLLKRLCPASSISPVDRADVSFSFISEERSKNSVLSELLYRQQPSCQALCLLYAYLRSLKLEHFMWGGHYEFETSTVRGIAHLSLEGSALESLDVIRPNHKDKGRDVLSLLDRCVTPFGKRMLRNWVAKPLADARAINDRLDGIDSLLGSYSFTGKFTKYDA